MQVHQVERNPTREVTVYPGNRHLPAYVGNTQVRQVGLCDCFVYLFVFFDASEEIKSGRFRRCILVVRIARADFQSNICCDDGRVVAYRFEEYYDNTLFLCNPRFNFCPFDSKMRSERMSMIGWINKFTCDFDCCSLHLCIIKLASTQSTLSDLPCIPTFPPSFSH